METERSGFSDREDDIASQGSDDQDAETLNSHRAADEIASPQPKDSMHAAFDASIRPKLDAIDKVRHHLTGVNIELPAIVVVGDQSSGKSSVLESLSGIGLPRGGNLVTRCPLELALRRGDIECAVLSYTDPDDGSKEITRNIHIDEVPQAVSAATVHLAGTKSGLVSALISLKVTKPEAPDLTLIDLPGIVRNPVGDQPPDIEQQIRELIHEHIQGESKVILCVLPATADFATQEAIKISRKFDPSGKRTVGVVTKIDLAEPGIRDRLEATGADHLRLELGYVAVRSRTPKELAHGMSSQQARDKEAELFRTDSELKDVAEEYKGVPALSRKLVQIQAERISSHLPALQKQVSKKLQAAVGQLQKMQGVISTDLEAETCLSGLLERMHRRAIGLVHATPEVSAGDHKAKELHIAPRVNEMFVSYMDELWEAIGGKNVFRSSDCYDLLREHSAEVSGVTLPNLSGDHVFNAIFTEQVYSNLKPRTRELVQSVHEYVEGVLCKLTEDVAAAFPRLQTTIKALIEEELDSLAKQATANAMNAIKCEKHVFTNNNSYMQLLDKMKALIIRKQEHVRKHPFSPFTLTKEERQDVGDLDVLDSGSNNNKALADLQMSLVAYTQIVVRNLCDSIPKLVYAQLITKSTKCLSSNIREGLSSDGDVSMLSLMHDPERVYKYKQLQETVENLKKANASLRKL